MKQLVKNLEFLAPFLKIDTAISKGQFPISVDGFLTEQRILHTAYLVEKLRKKIVFVVSSKKEVNDCKEAFEKMNLNVVTIDTESIRFYHIDAKDHEKDSENIRTMASLLYGEYDILLVSGEELNRKYMPPKRFKESIYSVSLGQICDREELCHKLVSLGYTREYKVEGVGQFSIRGGIVDIYSPSMTNPYRIEFFDDEIDSIRTFDVFSQKSLENEKRAVIYPAASLLYPDSVEFKIPHEEDLNDPLSDEVRMLNDSVYFEGMEKYVDLLYGKESVSLLEYCDEDILVIMVDSNRVLERIENIQDEFSESFKISLEKRETLKSCGNLLWGTAVVERQLSDRALLLHSYFPKKLTYFKPKALVHSDTRSSIQFQGRLNEFVEELLYLIKEDYIIFILDCNENSFSNIYQKLLDSGIHPILLQERTTYFENGAVVMHSCYLEKGFLFTDAKVAFYTGNDIFQNRKKKQSRKIGKKYDSKKIENFIQLKKGDYVVHETYGVGQFIEIEQREFDGIKKDYIKIAYFGGDSLYVPLEQMDKVQSFIGNSAEQAYKLSKLGSSDWKKSKARTKKAVEAIAQDLVELYAVRENEKGYSFEEDTVWQREFEDAFPYEETDDQLKAIEEVKRDMESSRVMDRLLCGDVGYGKTEVAIRAIFKACMDGKQVVFLVPTTILAQQHYVTIKERFSNYPLRVDLVSRFKTTKEVNETFDSLAKGSVDVVIGTHKILSEKIKYKNLGLIVVDEEQRFGVKQKEAIKKMRMNIDCLTLSATPIPRTLHLSLSGIREMSILNEPPQDRHPIVTYVTEAKSNIIADAIDRELARGGQVFFVYNRVETIDKIHTLLKELVPDADIAVAHGQMSSRKLEQIMVDFLNREYDVLVCTTIIETGMDISNANTMIVYDADKMGLSQLYQLRGRVGRSGKQGYAYFMYEKEKVLTEIAEKRLKTIREFTEFGSGFKVAMKDLEIRGAGNLLGESQSGHIANIGYDLYVRMLDEAIKKYKGELPVTDVETEIQLKLNGYIPNYYVEDEIEKIDIYKKIAMIDKKEDYEDLMDELCDRFGEIPISVVTLLDVSYLRALGKKGKVTKIYQKNFMVYFVGKDNKLITKKAFPQKDSSKLVKNIIDFLEIVV